MKKTISTIMFTVKNKDTGLPVNKCEIANEIFEDLEYPYEDEDFLYLYISQDGWLMISDEDGTTCAVEREGKYIITFTIDDANIYEMIY